MKYKKDYYRSVAVAVIPAVLTVFWNVFCLIIRTDENHVYMLWGNLLSDWACGVFLVFYISCCVLPRWELYRLSRRRRELVLGVVDQVQLQPVRYERLNCVVIHVGQRQLFLPEGLALPQVGQTVRLSVASNVILEVGL